MVVRFGAAICAAATVFACASSAFADGVIVSLASHAAEEFSIGSGTDLDARSVAYGNASSLTRSRETTGRKRTTPTAIAGTTPISGAASTYNPYRPGWREGGRHTASGELYDPAAWTAAIKTTLRHQFGGVHYGRDYRPAYALVESADKQVIVKINDVGPLTPGRVIDLNERTMHYFDPTLERGLIRRVKVTPLLGTYWTPGPVEVTAKMAVRSRRSPG